VKPLVCAIRFVEVGSPLEFTSCVDIEFCVTTLAPVVEGIFKFPLVDFLSTI